MNCSTAQARIDALLDNALPPAEATVVVDHLETCPACRHRWEWARAAQQALRHLAPPPAPEAARERVFARFERSRVEAPPPRVGERLRLYLMARPQIPVLVAAAAAAAAAFLIPLTPAEPAPFPAPQEIRLLIDHHDRHDAAAADTAPLPPFGED